MDRYGEAIEADLAERGIDLLDYFRGTRSWRNLLVILDHLPRASHFRQALADDDEWAEEVLRKQPEIAPPSSVPLSEFTREAELLTIVGDLLQAINANLRALMRDSSSGQPSPLPRPRTALDRAKERARDAALADLIAEVEEAQVRWAQMHGEEIPDGA